MPKSITFGTGTPSCRVTRMFDGLMSRWDDAFLVSVLHRVANLDERSSRCRVESLFWSQ